MGGGIFTYCQVTPETLECLAYDCCIRGTTLHLSHIPYITTSLLEHLGCPGSCLRQSNISFTFESSSFGALVQNESLTLFTFSLLTASFFEVKTSKRYQMEGNRQQLMTEKTILEYLWRVGQNIESKSIVKFDYSPCTYLRKFRYNLKNTTYV